MISANEISDAKVADEPPGSKLAAALAAFQSELPKVGKEQSARVDSERGRGYTYRYADLSDISPEVLPLLARHGLSWTCKPTMNHDGKFVLRYALMHTSGEVLDGDWPLPNPSSSSQVLGSAVTYARRYCLCAVTGVSPGGDDDDAAATVQRAAERRQNPPRTQPTQDGNGRQDAPQPDGGTPIPSRQVQAALSLLRQTCETNGWSLDKIAQIWEADHKKPIMAADSMKAVEEFRKSLFSRPDHELKDAEDSRA